MDYVSLSNPIWSCQLQILGGPRRMGYTAAIYAALLVGVTLLWARATGAGLAAAGSQILRYLAVAQIGILVLGGTSSIFRGLTRDHATRMMESLRISPMRGSTVVIGYAFGPTLQILALFLVGAVFGGFLARGAGGGWGLSAWVSGNLALLLAGASIWSMAAFLGMGAAKPANLTALIAVLAATQYIWLSFFPGLGLFLGAYAVIGSWHVMLNSIQTPKAFGGELALAGVMGLFWATAAMRRFRHPEGPALSEGAALGLVALACGCCLAAVAFSEHLLPPSWERMDEPGMLVLASLGAPFLFLHLPAATAVQSRRRLLLGGRAQRRSECWPPTLWAVLSALIAFTSVVAAGVVVRSSSQLSTAMLDAGPGSWMWTGCAYVSAALMATGVLKLFSITTGRTGWAILLAFMAWAAPPALAALRSALAAGHGEAGGAGGGWLSGCSPVGTLLGAWGEWEGRADLFPGYCLQWVVTIGLFALARRAERILTKKRNLVLETEAREASSAPSA